MRARLLKIVACVIAGLVINLAVAWGCVVAHGAVPFDWNAYLHPHGSDRIHVYIVRRFGVEWAIGEYPMWITRARYPWKKYDRSPWWPSDWLAFHYEDQGIAAGWPMLSFYSWQELIGVRQTESGKKRGEWVTRGGILLHPPRTKGDTSLLTALPYIPIWRGILINTTFYAASLWALITVPSALRRHVRTRKNQCPSCGYPDPGTGRCPECGEVLRQVSSRIV